MTKNKSKIRRFNAAAKELFCNGLYRQKIIPNKKKTLKLKRNKADIKEYQPYFFGYFYFLTECPSGNCHFMSRQ